MNFYCNRQSLLYAINNVQHAVSGKSTLPALEGLLIKASGSSLFLAGYDLELGITTNIEADVREEGKVVLTAKLFSDIIRKMPDDQIYVSVNERLHTTIKSGSSEFTIIGIDANEYPEIPSVDNAVGFTIGQDILKSMVKQTIFAVSQSDNRPAHTGTKFEIHNGVLRLVSVDGSRLAMRSEPISSSETIDFVVPGKTLSEVLKLLNEEGNPVSVAIGKRHIILEINGYAVISRLLEGDFLPYDKAIPSSHVTELIVNTRQLIDAVERASLVINDRIKSPLVCVFGENKINISCTTPLGSVSDLVYADIDGEDIEMGFNSKFLLEALKNTECDEVKIQLSGAISPMKIVPVKGDSYLFLVLPVRLKG